MITAMLVGLAVALLHDKITELGAMFKKPRVGELIVGGLIGGAVGLGAELAGWVLS